MAPRGDNKKEMDPEEQMRQKFRAKCLFRALGRLCIANTYWLAEAVTHYEGVEDVKRRVAQAVRSKAKKKQLLSINDKALLNKPAEDRTDQEKKYIYRIIGGLKCFKRYPNHVKKKLAAVTYFKYYGPGRTIVRQHHEAHALYFIVTGDVIVSQMIFDDLLQQSVSVDIAVMHPGDMFGEVSLLHNIPRTATVTTTDYPEADSVPPTSKLFLPLSSSVCIPVYRLFGVKQLGHCELLALMKEDFKNVLQASVQKQWDEVRDAMSAFTYFDSLDEVARREGCIVAKMKSFEPDETLLGDGVGVANFVYFVLSGRCQMIESIQVIVKTHLGKNHYTLYDPYVPKEESEEDFEKKYFGAYKNLNKSSKLSHSGYSEVEKTNGQDSNHSSLREGYSILKNKKLSSIVSFRSEVKTSITETIPENTNDVSITKQLSNEETKIVKDESENIGRTSSLKSELLHTSSNQVRESTRLSSIPEYRPNYKTYFMQVCQFNPGSSFGFGENMRDRRIVALTHVECMLMPKIWLLQRNTANIWSRIEHYLEKKIPTKKQLFKEFVSQRRWQDFRDQMVMDVVARSNTVNWTSVHDVPYSIRMEEMLDI